MPPWPRARWHLLGIVGLTACNDQKISVYHEPPIVAITEPSEATTFYEGQVVNFEAVVEVSDDSELTDVTHRWVSGNETLCESEAVSADGVATCSWSFETLGEITVEVTVTDPRGDRASAFTSIVIVDNTPPAIYIQAPGQDEYFASDELIVFEALVEDAEEPAEDLVVSVNSSIDGDLGFTTQPASSGAWTAGDTLSSGTHLLTYRVEDGFGQSDQDTNTIIVYDHGPPSVDSCNIQPSPADTNDDLSVICQGWEDLDGASAKYEYRWFYMDEAGDMVEDYGESTDSYPSGKTVRGDLFRVEVTPVNDYGDGDTVDTPTIEIANSAPTAPTIEIQPGSPQPEDSLQCVVSSGSFDDDGDTVTYVYEWYQNGIITAITGNVADASYTAHGDTWECVTTPTDGTDNGPSASASVTITDTAAPDAPAIDTTTGYRNDEEVTLTGTCEPDCALTFYCADTATSWTGSETCDSAGEFSYTTTLTRGETSSCFADCEDLAGNISGYSNTVDTEVCDPYDEYEDTAGYGDAGTDAIDEWSALTDSGSSTVSIEGNVLADDTEDWYVISTTDDLTSDLSAGLDYYNLAVEMVDGTSDYAFIVYKGSPDATDQECTSSSSGYTQYNDFVQDVGDGSHTIPADTRQCSSGSASYNDCADLSNSYYIQVFRRSSSVTSCQHYELEVTNGVW